MRKAKASTLLTIKIAGQFEDGGVSEVSEYSAAREPGNAAFALDVCTVTVAEVGVPFNVTVPGETVQVEAGGPPLQVSETVWLAAVPGVNDTSNAAGCPAVTVALELPEGATVNGMALTTCASAELELPVK